MRNHTKTFRFSERIVSAITVLSVALPLQLFAAIPLVANADAGPPPASEIFSDGFESGDFSKWTSVDDPEWNVKEAISNPNNAHEGDWRARIQGDTEGEDYLAKNLPAGYEDITVSYWVRVKKNLEPADEWRSEYSTDGGSSWTTLLELSDVDAGDGDESYVDSDENGWYKYQHSLPESANDNSGLWIRFVGQMNASTRDRVFLDDVLVTGEEEEKPTIQVFKFYDVDGFGGQYDDGDYPMEDWEFCLASGDMEDIFYFTIFEFAADNGFSFENVEDMLSDSDFEEFLMDILGNDPTELDILFFLIDEGYIDDDVVDCRETDSSGWVEWTIDVEGQGEDYFLFERLGDGWDMTYFDYSQWGEGKAGLLSGEGYASFWLYDGDRIELTFGNYFSGGTVWAEKYNDENGNGERDIEDIEFGEDGRVEFGDLPIGDWVICLYRAEVEQGQTQIDRPTGPYTVLLSTTGNDDPVDETLPIPIEIVQLDLVSCQPTDVSGQTQWNDVPTGWYVLDEENKSNWTNTTNNDPTEPFFLEDNEWQGVTFGNMYTPSATQSGGGGPQAELSVTKVASPTIVEAGGDVTYTITLTNSGTGSVNNLVVTDVLPPGLETGSTVDRTWTVDTIAPGETETIEYTITVLSDATAGLYTNTVTVTSTNNGPVSANETVEVAAAAGQVLGFDALPNVSVVVTADPPFATPGEPVTYTITVVNNGEAVAENVVVTIELPEGFEEGTSSVSSIIGNVFAALTNVAQAAGLTFAVGDLAPGDTWTKDVAITVGADVAPGSYNVTSTVVADNNDLVMSGIGFDVREGAVLGFDTIPETGGAPGAMETLALVILAVVSLYALGAYGLLRRKNDWSVTKIS